jgi:hypothetical protein
MCLIAGRACDLMAAASACQSEGQEGTFACRCALAHMWVLLMSTLHTQVANKLGETIYKGHRSYDLMLNLQLGIRHSSQQVAKEAPLKELSDEHFMQKVCFTLQQQPQTQKPCTQPPHLSQAEIVGAKCHRS